MNEMQLFYLFLIIKIISSSSLCPCLLWTITDVICNIQNGTLSLEPKQSRVPPVGGRAAIAVAQGSLLAGCMWQAEAEQGRRNAIVPCHQICLITAKLKLLVRLKRCH